MPLILNCPRCKKPLSVPSKKAGSYVNCVHCSGRLWVPKDAPGAAETPTGVPNPPPRQAAPDPSRLSGPAPGATVPLPPPPTGAPTNPAPVGRDSLRSGTWVPVSPPPAPTRPPGPPLPPGSPPLPAASPPGTSTGPPPPAAAPPVVPQPAASTRKVARFIAAEASKSTLKLAEDGHLPELRLEAAEKKAKKEDKTTTVNPLVLFGLIALSVVMSILLVMYEPAAEDTAGGSERDKARAAIAHDFFGDEDFHPEDPLKPYQRLLREANLAHQRKDYSTERRLYRKVLDMLREEDGGRKKLLTGDPDRDEELEQLITTILKGP